MIIRNQEETLQQMEKRLLQCFHNSEIHVTEEDIGVAEKRCVVFSKNPYVAINITDANTPQTLQAYVASECMDLLESTSNQPLKRYIFQGFNNFFHSDLSNDNLDMYRELLQSFTYYKSSSCPYKNLEQAIGFKMDEEMFNLIRDNFFQTGRIGLPSLAKGDKDFYANKYLDTYKQKVLDYVNNKIYDFDDFKSTAIELANKVQSIETAEEWYASIDVIKLNELIEGNGYSGINSNFGNQKISLDEAISYFCFEYYLSFEGFVEDLDKNTILFSFPVYNVFEDTSDYHCMYVLNIINEIAGKDKLNQNNLDNTKLDDGMERDD